MGEDSQSERPVGRTDATRPRGLDRTDVAAMLGLAVIAIAFVVLLATGEAQVKGPHPRELHLLGEAFNLRGIDSSWMRPVALVCLGALAVVAAVPGRWFARAWLRRTTVTVLLLCVCIGLALTTIRRAKHKRAYLDYYDTYSYLLGPRYIDELGYDKHYVCATAALYESGGEPPRFVRDLVTNDYVQGQRDVLDGEFAQLCRDSFSDQRWSDFSRDIAWFRPWFSSREWKSTNLDHGYNGPPPLTALVRALDDGGPLEERRIVLVGLSNPALLLAASIVLVWGFGWRLGLIVAGFLWFCHVDPFLTISSYIRYWWLASLLAAFALLRRGKYAASGALIAFSGSLKIFPLLFAVGMGVQALVHAARTRDVPRGHRRFLLGVVAGLALMFGLGTAFGGGLEAWTGFLHQMDLNSGRLATGRIGFIFDFLYPKDFLDKLDVPLRVRLAAADAVHLGFFSLTRLRYLLMGALSLWLVRHARSFDEVAFAIFAGFSLFFLWFPAVRYYYCGFLGLALMWHAQTDRPSARAYVAYLILLSFAAVASTAFVDRRFLFHTLYSGGFTVYIVAVLAFAEWKRRRRPDHTKSAPSLHPPASG